MHRSGKEEAVCSPLSRVLQADVREGLELELASRDSLPEDGCCPGGMEPGRRWGNARER